MEKPSRETVFLDLKIQIQNGKIITSTHHKPLKIHLYIPASSAHPPGVLYGLIAGSIRRFYLQNTDLEDYKKNILLLYERLAAQGHDRDLLKQLFMKSSQRYFDHNGNVERFIKMKSPTAPTDNTFLFHMTYHPKRMARRDIHPAFQHSLGKSQYYDRQVVCLS